MGVTMGQDDEVRLEEEARDLPGNIWFDLLNIAPLMTLLACALGNLAAAAVLSVRRVSVPAHPSSPATVPTALADRQARPD